MKVIVDPNAGFCPGVDRAIRIVEKALSSGGRVCSLGQLVHNREETDRLSDQGLEVIDRDTIPAEHNTTVVFRAHGEPPESYEKAREKDVRLLDATCPVVKRLQMKVKREWERISANNGQIVIFGKPGHPEVIGLSARTGHRAIIAENPDDIESVDFTRPVSVFSQTTMNPADLEILKHNVRTASENSASKDENQISFFDTICGHVVRREQQLRNFASGVDAVIFVGGRNSSNAR